jgi:hypothetical protein
MSRSVTSPVSLPSVSTRTVPTLCSFMALAAADTDSPGAMQTGAADMMSRTFLTVLHLLALIRMTLPPGGGRKRQVNAGIPGRVTR